MQKNIIIPIFTLLFFLCSKGSFAQVDSSFQIDVDTNSPTQYKHFLKVVKNTLQDYYKENATTKKKVDSIRSLFDYEDKEIPEFPDSVYCARLAKLNETTPFPLDCNKITLGVIKFFAEHRRHFTSVVLGRSKLYFTMFEAKLAKHGLPLELKYLAVIESGLRPTVKSHAGALGLWQFMYRTGKYVGLNITSYIDQRRDPEAATEAACRYLKKLYDIYGDWDLVLAAYNAGPGNVNKAIRRSGGYMDYWKIRPFLPRETQGYVPNFIAMDYLMNYHIAHNIKAFPPKYHDYAIDTVCLSAGLHMKVIDSLLNWPIAKIRELNPVFKTTYIPKTDPKQCIHIPKSLIPDWIVLEDSIYHLDSVIYRELHNIDSTGEPTIIFHYVRRGQTLSDIADRYGVPYRRIMQWNNMHSTRLAIGQRVKIYLEEKPSSGNNKENKHLVIHKVRSGQTLGGIAGKYGVSYHKIMRWNDLNSTRLSIGQRLKIYVKGRPDNKKKDLVIHRVRKGQTLSSIADRYNTSYKKIMRWNNMHSTSLSIGQQLKIYPNGKPHTASKKTKKDKEDIAASSGEGVSYTIQSGDNLWVIANRRGIDVDVLKALNPGINYRDLKVGQKIRVQ